MLSAIFGIAIVALPAGIITAGYMDEINKNKDNWKYFHWQITLSFIEYKWT